MAPTVKEAVKKLRNRVKELSADGKQIDRFYADLIRDLKQHPDHVAIDSPRLNPLED